MSYLKHKAYFHAIKNIHRIEKILVHSRTNGGKTHFIKNNSRTSKIQEHSRISRTSGHLDFS